MAAELTLTAKGSFAKGKYAAELWPKEIKVDVAGTKYTRGVQEIGIAEEALDLGDVGTVGYCIIVNRDDTNFVSVRPGTATANCIKLKAGEFAMFRAEVAPWLIADTAACLVEYLVVED